MNQPIQAFPSHHSDEPSWEDPYQSSPHNPSLTYPTKRSRMPKFNTIFSDDEDDHHQRWSSVNNLNGIPSLSSVTPSSVVSGFVDPVLSSTAYHIHLAENALSTLKHIILEEGWKKALKHKSGIVVHMKNGMNKTDKTPIFKGEYVIQGFSPQSIFYVIGMRRLWDEQYEDGSLIENLNDTTSLTYEITKATATSKPRDLALVEKIECTQNGSIIFACTSVETPRIPRIQGHIRANIKLQGWILEPVRGPVLATRVIYVIQESMKGWVPGFAKKSLARRPLVIALINEYLQKKADRMRAQHKIPQLSSKSHIRRPSVLSYQSEQVSNKGNNKFHTMQPSHNYSISTRHDARRHTTLTDSQRSILLPSLQKNIQRPSTKHITFAEFDTSNTTNMPPEAVIEHEIRGESLKQQNLQSHSHASPVRNETPEKPATTPVPSPPSKHLYPAQRHMKKKADSLKLLKELFTSMDYWSFAEEKESVKHYKYQRVKSLAPTFIRTETTIDGQWSAEQLCSAIQCFGARKQWDTAFREGQVVERFSQKEYLVRWIMQEHNAAEPFDICALSCIETDPVSGAIFTASTSVTDSQLPMDPQRNRAQMVLYGWIFTPVIHPSTKAKAVKATFIGHVETPGDASVRQWQGLTEHLSTCMKHLRHYVKIYGCPPYIRRVAGKIIDETYDPKRNVYEMTYIAKHEPSSSYKTRRKSSGGWYTDIRISHKLYPEGFDVQTSPSAGVSVEFLEDRHALKVFTTDPKLDRGNVTVHLMPQVTPKSTCKYTWNGVKDLLTAANVNLERQNKKPMANPAKPASKEKKVEKKQENEKIQTAIKDTTTEQLSSTQMLQVPKGYVLVPEHQVRLPIAPTFSERLTDKFYRQTTS
ncbi:uncharacterized protein BYT42DRAFT_576424 [Radiomyces spectabilis]|uniref:uncharacterized protein n=1 Tax=Radiomyces spectabilis TaxID=64574 RepID=UPI00221FD383|nr:uncharacterized protein BYT42DRAFT_576424 [Radiomyces spectabilis]KAI8374455.1 hypothetical protein BYT42DRAFT_576424 [Radiomyces spectabilis]